MKRLLSVCFALILTFALLIAACAEGIDNTLDTVADEPEILSGMIEPEVPESEDLALTGYSFSTDIQSPEVSASEDRAVSVPMPKAGNCAHKKYSKIKGVYRKYEKIDSKSHSVTTIIPDDPSVTGVTCYFVKCDACGETGFFFEDHVTWESEGESYYYAYAVISDVSVSTEAHTFSNGKCSKCGCKGGNTVSVKLNAKSVTLGTKETFKLSATVNPSSKAKNVRYKSSNTGVATVDAQTGKITAKAAGTATIKAYIGTTKLASCKVTVKKAPKKVTLNKIKATLEKGKTYQLKATLPQGTYTSKLTWTSSNKKVAKVSSKGKVTTVGKGTATITVKTAGCVKATCKVTVKSSNATTNRIELKEYMGKELNKITSALGLFYRTSCYTNSDSTIDVFDDYEKYPGLVSTIGIYNYNTKHCIEGVYIGMTHSAAKKELISRGYTYSVETMDSQKRYVFTKGKYTMDYSLNNGVVQGLYIYLD